jgi:hypothetical protein
MLCKCPSHTRECFNLAMPVANALQVPSDSYTRECLNAYAIRECFATAPVTLANACIISRECFASALVTHANASMPAAVANALRVGTQSRAPYTVVTRANA